MPRPRPGRVRERGYTPFVGGACWADRALVIARINSPSVFQVLTMIFPDLGSAVILLYIHA
ncbi:MAG TPA: hypothetical protein PLN56_07440 [Methanoregulaceae archaeon]|nr:hypothetical protein [Methanoregulaceae archaeon]